LGTVLYYAMAFAKVSIVPLPGDPTADYHVAWYPHPANFYSLMKTALVKYGAIAIPYAILVNIGGISVVSSAQAEGNDYSTVSIQLSDAFCTILVGVFGGVSQTTPYIGHSVYRRVFNANASYTLFTGLFIGLGGIFGYISLVAQVLPKPAIMPIFIFVAFEIVGYSFHDPGETQTITKFHSPAIILALFPAIAQVIQIIISQLYDGQLLRSAIDPAGTAAALGLPLSIIDLCGMVVILAHGFIATSLLWGSTLAFVIDRQLSKASLTLFVAALLAFFGVIHSVDPDGSVYLPWTLDTRIPIHWAIGYTLIAVMTFLSRFFLVASENESQYDSINSNHSDRTSERKLGSAREFF